MKTFGIRIYKEYFNFAAAHFLIFEDGTREELHGHNYHVQMQIEGNMGEGEDVFIDFLHIKPMVKAACDAIDHKTLLPANSKFLKLDLTQEEGFVWAYYQDKDKWCVPTRDVVILPTSNTSAERLAEYLCIESLKRLNEQYPQCQIKFIEFSVEESKGQSALFRWQSPVVMHLENVLKELQADNIPLLAASK